MNTYRTIATTHGPDRDVHRYKSKQSDDLESALKARRSAPISRCLYLQELRGEVKTAEPAVTSQPTKRFLTLNSSKKAGGPFVRGRLSSVNCLLAADGTLVSIKEVLSLSLPEEYRLLNYEP